MRKITMEAMDEIAQNTAYERQYRNILSEVRDKFPEFKFLEDYQLEVLIKLYEEHIKSIFHIWNPAYYVIGSMLLLSSFMFVNAVNLQSPQPEFLGLTIQELIDA